jgi:hypothetical protein
VNTLPSEGRSDNGPQANYASVNPNSIVDLGFIKRPASWVATSGPLFYKVVRRTDDPKRDFEDPVCIEQAREEYTQMLFLHKLSPQVCRPTRLERGCIVYPRLSGPDMYTFLRDGCSRDEVNDCLQEAVVLLAKLHAGGDMASDYTEKNYRTKTYNSIDPTTAKFMGERRRTIIIDGFEVRNLRFDDISQNWYFFDPHHVSLGFPEEDFARFVVSLLMINWNLKGRLHLWKNFDVSDLLLKYNSVASERLEKKLINFFLHDAIMMRKHFATKSLNNMPALKRYMGGLYLFWYFYQLKKWAISHEI